MSKRVIFCLVLLALLACVPVGGRAQGQASQGGLTMVSEWTIPRAQWGEWTAYEEKNVKPLFERLLAEGTIQGWGFYETAVHQEGEPTHGGWIYAESLVGIDKALAELAKLPPSPIPSAPTTKHRDYLLRSRLRGARAASGSGGYLWVNQTMNQPGKYADYRAVWDRYVKPMMEELLAQGTIVEYGIEAEQIHTLSADIIYIYCVAPSAEGMDKFLKSLGAVSAKMPPEAHAAIEATEVASGHQDFFGRVTSFGVR